MTKKKDMLLHFYFPSFNEDTFTSYTTFYKKLLFYKTQFKSINL